MKKITKLQVYQKAKIHFSKKENKPGRIDSCDYPKALCNFVHDFFKSGQLTETNYHSINRAIDDAVDVAVCKSEKRQPKFLNKYNGAYFPTDAARMNFIKSQIESLTK